MSLDKLDYYTLLGVDDEASIAQVKAAFRKFARKYHPDRYAGADPEKIEKATAIYRRGSEAYQVLTDPPARAAYDQALAKGELRLTSEARDKASVSKPRAKRKEHPVRSAQARTLFEEAVDASKAQDWERAYKTLKAACEIEPGNPFLEDRLKKLAAYRRPR